MKYRTSTKVIFSAMVVVLLSLVGCGESDDLKITSVSPSSGSVHGGSIVTIHGNGFKKVSSLGEVAIYFGKEKATFVRFEGNTKMLIRPPAGELNSLVDILVVFGNGSEHKYEKAFKYVNPNAGFDIEALAPPKK